MPHRTFFTFILPSLVAMVLFITLPIFSIMVQSLFVEHEKVMVEVENCGPFGCTTEHRVDAEATAKLQEEAPLGKFAGLSNYTDRNHLAFAEVRSILSSDASFSEKVSQLMNLPFWRALAFTITYCLVVTPIGMALGFAVALGVNALPRVARGPAIFVSILPMIITPLIGALILFWMLSPQGVLGATLQTLLNDPKLTLQGSAALTWIALLVYGVWSNGPFSFVVFYAGLQTVPSDTLESALIDGASRWERIRFVVIPHLAPLATFVGLVQLMDNFRVFEPIVGFSAEANATSLSWLVFNDLLSADTQQFGSAGATSIITIAGIIVLLIPVLVRTWRDFNRKVV